MSFIDNGGAAGNSLFNGQLQTLFRSLLAGGQNKGPATGNTPLSGGEAADPQQNQSGGQQQVKPGTQYSALGAAAGLAAPAVKSLMQSLKGGGQSPDAGGPDEGTENAATVAGGPDIEPPPDTSASISSAFFTGFNGS